MIEELFNLIKEKGGDVISNNAGIPKEMNEEAMKVAHNTLVDGLRGFNQDDLSQLQSFVQAGNFSAPNQQMGFLTNSMTKSLTEKLGLDSGITKTLVVALLPILLKNMFSKGNSTGLGAQTGGLDLGGILGSILGGGSTKSSQKPGGGLLDNLGKMAGLDKNGDGKIDLGDLGGFLKK